jgi:hypothetical protein
VARIPTVFISSRMEELAMERRSAFSAIAEAGLTPLVFETEPTRQEKAKIDLLVDRADYFVGLYYLTFGRPSEELYGLSPIEYEFVRFYARFDVVNSPESFELSATDRARIDSALASKRYRDSLLSEIKKSPQSFEAPGSRTLLLQRVSSTEDLTISSRLSSFLAELNVESIKNEPRTPPLDTPSIEPLFPPLHVTLYQRLYDWALNDRKPLEPEKEKEEAWMIYGEVQQKDRAGLMYLTLKGFFDFGLNIDASWAIVHDKQFTMYMVARNFHYYHSFESLKEEIFDEVFYGLLGGEYSIRKSREEIERVVQLKQVSQIDLEGRLRESNLWELCDRLPEAQGVIYYYNISAYDVPGALMEIARLVFHFAGSILFLCSGDFASEVLGEDDVAASLQGVAVGPIILGVKFDEQAEFSGAKKSALFDYEVLSLLSVKDVQKLDGHGLTPHLQRWKQRHRSV